MDMATKGGSVMDLTLVHHAGTFAQGLFAESRQGVHNLSHDLEHAAHHLGEELDEASKDTRQGLETVTRATVAGVEGMSKEVGEGMSKMADGVQQIAEQTVSAVQDAGVGAGHIALDVVEAIHEEIVIFNEGGDLRAALNQTTLEESLAKDQRDAHPGHVTYEAIYQEAKNRRMVAANQMAAHTASVTTTPVHEITHHPPGEAPLGLHGVELGIEHAAERSVRCAATAAGQALKAANRVTS